MRARQNPAYPLLDLLQPWLRVVCAMEQAGWDTHGHDGHHQRLAWACAATLRELERRGGAAHCDRRP